MAKTLKRIFLIGLVLVLAFFAYVFFTTPFISIFALSDTVNLSLDDVQNIAGSKPFGNFIGCDISGNVQVSSGQNEAGYQLKLKLFNLVTIKTIKLNTLDEELFVGGDIVGFALNGDGVVVITISNVETENGVVETLRDSDIKRGDIIKKIAGEDVESVADICRIVNSAENKGKTLDVEVLRDEKTISTTITPALDKNSRIYKLGLWVKDDASGIGTLTYVKKDDLRFGALGHAICDGDTKTVFNIHSGKVYPCTIIGINKGAKGKAGEMKGLFLQGKNNYGNVDKNCGYGVFGTMNKDCKLLKEKQTLKAGGRLYAKPGKAYIRTSIDGKEIRDYEIEIVKTNYQSTNNEKSMVIKVTDKELLKKTGGIIQGMSGSPIIQNERIVGAVTHVFINDPSKGFGIYLDWMINQ